MKMGLTFRRADVTAALRQGQDLPTAMVSCSVSVRYFQIMFLCFPGSFHFINSFLEVLFSTLGF